MSIDIDALQNLRFVHEDSLQSLPTQAITLTYPMLLNAGAEVGITPHRLLHGEQQFVLAGPLPTAALLKRETRIVPSVDKSRGAVC